MPRRSLLVPTAGTLLGLIAWTSGRQAPETAKYRVDIKSHQVIDLSPVNQPSQTQEFGATGFLTISLKDSMGGRAMDAVLDSMKVDSTSPIPQSVADSAKGSTWHAVVSPQGKISGLTPGTKTTAGGQFESVLAGFFPRVKTGAKPGDAWTDTLDYASDQGPATFTMRTVTNYTAPGTEARGGVKALKVQAAYSAARTGTVHNPQGEMNIEGNGTGTGTYYVGTDGRFLGGESKDSTNLSVVAPFAPAPIPITSTTRMTITRLP